MLRRVKCWFSLTVTPWFMPERSLLVAPLGDPKSTAVTMSSISVLAAISGLRTDGRSVRGG